MKLIIAAISIATVVMFGAAPALAQSNANAPEIAATMLYGTPSDRAGFGDTYVIPDDAGMSGGISIYNFNDGASIQNGAAGDANENADDVYSRPEQFTGHLY